MDTTPLSGQPIWTIERSQRHWTGLGAPQLLDQPLTAFFASRQCPGAAIRAAMDWALEQASARRAVVGGFHSPLEQSVLKILLESGSPAIAVLARPVRDAVLPSEWAAGVQRGVLTVVSATGKADRLTRVLAEERNRLVAVLADRIVVAHVSPKGLIAELIPKWQSEDKRVEVLDS